MNNKKKPLNIVLSILIAIVAVSLLGGKFLSSTSKDRVISTASRTSSPTIIDKKEDTLLTVKAVKNSGCMEAVQLNDEKLLALPQRQFVTHHSWSEKAESFSGPSLEKVLDMVCSNTKKIKLTALNDYAVEIDFSQIKKYQPIIALSVDGKRLSIREKGPLWIMLPLDDHKDITDKKSLDGLMIWQLSDIEILKTDDEAS